MSELSVGPTQLPVKFKWIVGALSQGVKWSVFEGDDSRSSARLRMCAFSVALR
jgi:hypothetical protein